MVDIKPEKLLLPEEVNIYEQGLKQDFDAGLIGRWIGKFEGVCDLSMRWESGDNDFYKDYLLDEVFDNGIRKLKEPGCVFGSVEDMNRYFTEHSEFMLNLKGRGWAYTFRVLTNLFAFYFIFLPTDDGCDFFIYVFDKKSFFSYTAQKRGLPVYCYGLRENMCVRIDFGMQDDYMMFYISNEKELRKRNQEIGVSKEQSDAMTLGYFGGWYLPGTYLVKSSKKSTSSRKEGKK